MNELIEKVQIEAGMEVDGQLGDANKSKLSLMTEDVGASAAKDNEMDSLESRLKNLKEFWLHIKQFIGFLS